MVSVKKCLMTENFSSFLQRHQVSIFNAKKSEREEKLKVLESYFSCLELTGQH